MLLTMKIALVGSGNISGTYLENAQKFKSFEIVYIADLELARAEAQAMKYGVKALPMSEVFTSDADVILNLTIPAAHGEIALQALEAGKHIYNEKPLAVKLEEAKNMLDLATTKGLRVGCAPDTFLGAGLQTARAIVDAGELGHVVGASLHMLYPGPDSWHPNPAFFFQVGAGPLFDMGPYYLTAVLHLFGAIKRVSAFSSTARQVRQGTNGESFTVETPTHITAILEHITGQLVNVTMSFDAYSGTNANIEVYGSKGALMVGDPNMFGNTQKLRTDEVWQPLENTRPYFENARGVGLADMIQGIHQNRPHRASGELAFHVLEVMHAILAAAQTGVVQHIQSCPPRPAALEIEAADLL